MVVVGDQSAGKSSVLESLTGFHFPRSVTLCTRHATEIICRREDTKSITVSIHALGANADEARSFRRTAKNLNAKAFAQIFQDACLLLALPQLTSVTANFYSGIQGYGYQVRDRRQRSRLCL